MQFHTPPKAPQDSPGFVDFMVSGAPASLLVWAGLALVVWRVLPGGAGGGSFLDDCDGDGGD